MVFRNTFYTPKFLGVVCLEACNLVNTSFFLTHGSVHHNSFFIKIQPDATVYRYLFTAKSLYMFRVSQHPSSGVQKTVTTTSGICHNTGTATSLQRGLSKVCVPRH